MIKSPYFNDDELVNDLEVILKKYNIKQFFIAFSEDVPEKVAAYWQARSNIHSNGMADYLKTCADFINDNLEEDES